MGGISCAGSQQYTEFFSLGKGGFDLYFKTEVIDSGKEIANGTLGKSWDLPVCWQISVEQPID